MSLSSYTQEVILPSKGYLNPEIPEGKLIQRCMMVADQKFLASANLQAEDLTREILNRTIESPENIDVANLTSTDSLYLLFKLRILSYGENYKFKYKCPECGKRFDVDMKLSELVVDTLEPDFADGLKVVLPRTGDTVYTKFLRNSDISYINDELARRKRRNPNDDSEFILRLSSMITKIELVKANSSGDKVLEHPLDIQNYVEKLTDLDATAIRATTDTAPYGIRSTVEYKCPHCKEYIDMNIHFGANFFRPKYDIQH